MARRRKCLVWIVSLSVASWGLIASTASSHTPATFSSEQSSTTIRAVHDAGTSLTVFSVTGQTVTCETEEYHGSVSGTSVESVTITPVYTGCTAFGFVSAKITGFGHYGESEKCDFVLKASGALDLSCPAGKEMTIDAGTCTVHVPAQSNLGTVTFTAGTREGKADLTLDINLTGITVSHTDGFGCPFSGSGEVPNASLTTKATAWGQNPESGAPVGISRNATVAKTETTLSTSLSGEGKSGEGITVSEGSKVKDTATLSGTSASKAGGTVNYKVYADSSCKELVTSAGEVTVSSGSVPNSSEVELTAGAVYYWQAEYSGDENNLGSVSTCNKEVLTVKANTSLSTSLSGEGKSGEAITVNEGSKVKDTATLSGTKSSKAGGTVKYKVYADSSCKELVTSAGEATVTSGSVPNSSELELTAGAVYYWQAEYSGDSLHNASASTCNKEVLTVKAGVALSTLLVGEAGEEGVEGKEITVAEGAAMADTATLSGTNASKAGGAVEYFVYADSECKEGLLEAGEGSVAEASAEPSEEVELEAGTYYWQAEYSGDALHLAATSPCDEVATVIPPTSLATSLSGEGEEGEVIEVSGDATVIDTATLSGTNAAEATGTVEYSVYADMECEELLAEAGEVEVEGSVAPSSEPIEFEEPGIYFWRAIYSGDGANYPSESGCSEVQVVRPPLTTSLTGGGLSDAEIEVTAGTPVTDQATLHGENASKATGTVTYAVYADMDCEELVEEAGEVEVEGAVAPSSEAVEFEEAGAYYWQAEYSGDESNPPATGTCGSEVSYVVTATSVSTSLSGGGEEGEEIEVEEGTAVTDQATLSGPNAETAEGLVSYSVYADSECTELVELGGDGEVSEGVAEPSDEIDLPPGTYYWQAEYYGDGANQAAANPCGDETEVVTTPITTVLTGEEQTGHEIEVEEGVPVTDQATLDGEHASEATGTVTYAVYADEECEVLVEGAGEVEVEGAVAPSSEAIEFDEEGIYYWQAVYSGDETNPKSVSPCESTQVRVDPPEKKWKYAALGDSYSSGEGIRWDGVPYYQWTNDAKNRCHRSPQAWPALIAEQVFGTKEVEEAAVFANPPKMFIFRACSNAQIRHVWNGAGKGQFDEVYGGNWEPKPTQAAFLVGPGGDIGRVSLTIGGNDAGFGEIGRRCIQWQPEDFYTPDKCLDTVALAEDIGFKNIQAELPVILKEIRKAAPKATIHVLFYPQVINLVPGSNIPVGVFGLLRINNTKRRINKDNSLGPTAAQAVSRFADQLNQKIQTVAENSGVENLVVVKATGLALAGHQLGSKKPWIHGFILPTFINGLFFPWGMEESFHPNRCGHLAIASIALPVIAPRVPKPEEAIKKCAE